MKTTLFYILILGGFALAAYPQPDGLWLFDDPAALGKSTLGPNLLEVGTHTAVSGLYTGDGAVADGIGSYYICTHGLASNGGGTSVNQWTLLLDVKLPASSAGKWVSLFQTNTSNSNDGDCFISTNQTIGVSATGYTANTLPSETWSRVVISVSNQSFYRIYVNGVKWLEGTAQPLDGRFALDATLLFFADESGEDYPLHCTCAALWGQALTDQQALTLGDPFNPVLQTAAAEYAGLNLLSNPSGQDSLTSWTIIDGCDWQASDRTDWHFPHTGAYYFTSGRSSSGRITQTIDLTFLASEIDSGIVIAKAGGCLGGANQDQGRILVEYLDSNNTLLTSSDSGWIQGPPSHDWLSVNLPDSDGLLLPSGTRTARFSFLTQRLTGKECDAFGDDFVWEYALAPAGSLPPQTPSIKSSSTSALIDNDIAFMFNAVDPEADQVTYQVDWGEDSLIWSEVRPSGANYIVSHRWQLPGTYSVRTRARDINGCLSPWSDAYPITITGNAPGVFKSQPYLQNVSPDAITIAWETDRLVSPTVQWGLTASYGSQTQGLCINAAAGVYICKVRISGLSPAAQYHFRAHSGSTTAPDATFRTAPDDTQTPFTFAVWGDSQRETVNPAASLAMFSDMTAAVDFGVAVGDIVQDSSYSYFANPFRKYLCDIFARKNPVFVAFGNHDEPQASVARKAIQNPGMLSFSFNYANAHFTCIDYNQCINNTLPDDGSISSLPLDWLQQDLASDDAQNAAWRFVFIHVPPYSERWVDGSQTLRTYLVPLMKQYNVHICFSGHVHEYARGSLDGIYYVITGCGSYLDTVEPIVAQWPHMTVGGAHNIGPFVGGCVNSYTKIDINNTELTLTQHAYYADGTYYGLLDTVCILQADLNRDGIVNIVDFAMLAESWQSTPKDDNWNPACDLADRPDKTIDINDLAAFVQYWQSN